MGRYSRLRYIQTLDPETDYNEIFRLVTQYEFPWEYRSGFKMEGWTDMVMPSITMLLVATGQFEHHGQKRVDDTSLFEYEAKTSGLDSPHGRDSMRALNKIHGRYEIANEDYLFILASWVVEPIRWINTFGWRKLSDHEIKGLVESHRRMAQLMGVKGIPKDYAGFVELLEREKRDRAHFAESNHQIATYLLDIIQGWVPTRILKTAAARVAVCLIPDDVRLLLGLPAQPRWLTAVVRACLRCRARIVRWLPPRPDSRPCLPKPRSYPLEWTLSDLGPNYHGKAAHPSADPRPSVV